MKLEQQLTSLELSKRLKELGVKQESLFVWAEQQGNPKSIWFLLCTDNDINEIGYDGYEDYASAFTTAELGEMLPARLLAKLDKTYGTKLLTEPDDTDEWDRLVNVQKYETVWLGMSVTSEKGGHDGWECNYGADGTQYIEFDANTEADARAAMLIYLLENKLIPNPTDNI